MELDDSRRTLGSIASGGAITDDTCRVVLYERRGEPVGPEGPECVAEKK